MELVLSEFSLDPPGGAQTYLLTLAGHLQRLGHEVTLFTVEDGGFAGHVREHGLRVTTGDELPATCDAILAQDAATAGELAARYPRTPQAFVMHSAEFDIELPPQAAGLTQAVVVMNDRVGARARAMALDARIVRLRQPIDPLRFASRRHARERPRTALLLGNMLTGARRAMLTDALEAAGIAWEQLGAAADAITYEPERSLADADIVIGYGRAVLEGMACGCAAYVYDLSLDGWITPESYPRIEADGFAGLATSGVATPERLAADLAAYTPAMGVAARELITLHHSPHAHANEVAELLAGLAPGSAPAPDAARELARLNRSRWELERRALGEARGRHAQIEELRRWNDGLQDEVAKLHAELVRAQEALQELSAATPAAPAGRRYRAADAVLRPLDAVRRRRGSA